MKNSESPGEQLSFVVFIDCGSFGPAMRDHKCSVYFCSSYGSPACVCASQDGRFPPTRACVCVCIR